MDGIEAEFKMQQNSFDKIPFRQFPVYIDSTSLIFLAQYWVVTKQKNFQQKYIVVSKTIILIFAFDII